uniref:OCEL domain-containing protein n=2 Tax=Tetraodon nigroviridis TaxID=99883 RepID=H3DIJ6_TETNG
MAALRENRSYGLSGRLSRGRNLSVFHVKLTDSAARAIDGFRNGEGWSKHPTISFRGSRGSITIPSSERGGQLRIFTFGLANVASDRLQGTFDCVQQPAGSSSSGELLCLGVVQKRLKVDATDDSYQKARQSVAQAEEESRSQGAIVIKGVERERAKKATTPASKAKPGSLSQTPLTFTRKTCAKSRQRTSASAAGSRSSQEVKERPLKERLIHLLVLRPYRRSELLLRLQKDGLTDRDGDGLDSVLKEVGDLSRGDAFVLKSGLFAEVQKDWPGYTAGELQLLKRILVRRLFEPQQNLLAVPQIRVSPLRETPGSSPVHPTPSELQAYTDPLVKRRPRISHLSKKTASERPGAARHLTRTNAAEKRSSLDPRRLFGSPEEPPPKSTRKRSSEQVGEAPGRFVGVWRVCYLGLSVREGGRTHRRGREERRPGFGEHRPRGRCRPYGWERRPHPPEGGHISALSSPPVLSFSQIQTQIVPTAEAATCGGCSTRLDPPARSSIPEIYRTYSVISSRHQRQSYKQEFNQDYSEYRLLHARIDDVTQQFMQLNAQLQQLSRESCKYREVHDRIIQAYHKIQKSNPNYQQEKLRCEYLHNKLAHIKKLISAYDQQQLLLDH